MHSMLGVQVYGA